MNRKDLLKRISRGDTNNIRFSDFQHLVEGFGFRLRRITGSHHIYVRSDLPGNLNLQPENGDAISNQVKQFQKLVEKYELQLEE